MGFSLEAEGLVTVALPGVLVGFSWCLHRLRRRGHQEPRWFLPPRDTRSIQGALARLHVGLCP